MRIVLPVTALLLLSAPAVAQDGGALIKKHGCVACHSVDKPLIGPPYREVAKKYSGQAGMEAKLVDKVKKGGSGVWGPVPMPPNAAVPDADIQTMVKWVLSQK